MKNNVFKLLLFTFNFIIFGTNKPKVDTTPLTNLKNSVDVLYNEFNKIIKDNKNAKINLKLTTTKYNEYLDKVEENIKLLEGQVSKIEDVFESGDKEFFELAKYFRIELIGIYTKIDKICNSFEDGKSSGLIDNRRRECDKIIFEYLDMLIIFKYYTDIICENTELVKQIKEIKNEDELHKIINIESLRDFFYNAFKKFKESYNFETLIYNESKYNYGFYEDKKVGYETGYCENLIKNLQNICKNILDKNKYTVKFIIHEKSYNLNRNKINFIKGQLDSWRYYYPITYTNLALQIEEQLYNCDQKNTGVIFYKNDGSVIEDYDVEVDKNSTLQLRFVCTDEFKDNIYAMFADGLEKAIKNEYITGYKFKHPGFGRIKSGGSLKGKINPKGEDNKGPVVSKKDDMEGTKNDNATNKHTTEEDETKNSDKDKKGQTTTETHIEDMIKKECCKCKCCKCCSKTEIDSKT